MIDGFRNDTICAGFGDDQVTWNPGDQDPNEAAGFFTVDGGPGNDKVVGGFVGWNVLYGGAGDDAQVRPSSIQI